MQELKIGEVMVTMEPVENSATVKLIGYDMPSRMLVVAFANGSVYSYKPVVHEAYAALKNSESKGSHLNAKIKSNSLIAVKKER